jgi:hypothetical protein
MIKILYSHLNISGTDYKIRPPWFDFEKCFKNLISSSTGIEIHVIYDVTRGDVNQNWISKYSDFCTIHKIQGGTMEKAAMEMYKIAKDLSESMNEKDLFYFLENDYLHLDNWFSKVNELYATFSNLGYISLYDHNDKYFLSQYDDLTSKIIATHSHHWRTTPSTCGSYIISKKVFLEDYDIHTGVIGDHNKWLYLNEHKERFILTPIPGLSTHCMDGLLSPTINWEKINNI